ncbi:GTP cyclohydrolase FolE2 [Roseateles koreensis]|uniref:GTP cyclohydrolase FolE2 n=1 Tax=Roseateles koreensis TaxID=2987526 RepID=A0ABT5KWS6_9BURK|nr:GTP cyclohydrolase FolE2 [Roseateles koreensis]MDC8786276.1 GTP cyclohydrolase FolE2 [Roseateles koreensis]
MNQVTSTLHIPDTQSERDERHLLIQRVGVKDVRYPLQIQVGKQAQGTVGQWTLDVALPAEKKGTHMSRFVAWLDALKTPLDAQSLRKLHGEMLTRLEAVDGRIEVRFPFFIRKRAPVSGIESMLDYQGALMSETRDGRTSVWAEVAVPVKSLCPCSKEISDYGAHNQRSLVTIRAEMSESPDAAVSWQELVRYAEESASSEIWPLLKRSDEKWITEHAYENPKFVEDLVRDVALRLNADARIARYAVDVENFESIHNHSAYARIEHN